MQMINGQLVPTTAFDIALHLEACYTADAHHHAACIHSPHLAAPPCRWHWFWYHQPAQCQCADRIRPCPGACGATVTLNRSAQED